MINELKIVFEKKNENWKFREKNWNFEKNKS